VCTYRYYQQNFTAACQLCFYDMQCNFCCINFSHDQCTQWPECLRDSQWNRNKVCNSRSTWFLQVSIQSVLLLCGLLAYAWWMCCIDPCNMFSCANTAYGNKKISGNNAMATVKKIWNIWYMFLLYFFWFQPLYILHFPLVDFCFPVLLSFLGVLATFHWTVCVNIRTIFQHQMAQNMHIYSLVVKVER
jgi:hypothetical protein